MARFGRKRDDNLSGLVDFLVEFRSLRMTVVADKELQIEAHSALTRHWRQVQQYASRHPDFNAPHPITETDPDAPEVVKLIQDHDQRKMELFSMDDDPGETTDLYADARNASAANRMISELEEIRKKDRLLGKAISSKPAITRDRAEKLKALGYVQ